MKRSISIGIVMVLLLAVLLPTGAFATENPVPKAKQAVVMVYSGIYYDRGELETYDYRGRFSSGTAFGVYGEGPGASVFATNAHVVCNDKNQPYDQVYICVDGADIYDRSTVVECKILYVDTRVDVAIIQAEAPIGGVGTLPLKLSEDLETGDYVYALGYPGITDEVADENNYTAEDITVTNGIISRYMTSSGVKCMAHTAAVNHGNSGGPLIDQYGNAIGINSFIHLDSSTADLRSYAIYIDYAMEALDELEIPYVLASDKGPSQPAPGPSRETEPGADAETQAPANTVPGPGAEDTTEEESGLSGKMVLIIAGAAAAVILVIVLIVLLTRKKPDQRGSATRIQGPAVMVYAVSGPLQGQAWRLDTVLTVGRDYGNAIVFPADTKGISRNHCRIERRGVQIVVTDLGSTYGTFVSGRRLAPNVPVAVGLNAEIWLGSERTKLKIRG